MAEYLLIETQGPWDGAGGGRFIVDAVTLADAGEEVVLFLVQDAVAAAADVAGPVRGVLEHGGQVWVDDFSLARRGLGDKELAPGVQVRDMAAVAAVLLRDAVRVVWH
jgi:sulfur relay (sulfurtransferase) DsrF/TusC family protein